MFDFCCLGPCCSTVGNGTDLEWSLVMAFVEHVCICGFMNLQDRFQDIS